MQHVDPARAAWRKSTYSSGNSACVEVAFVGDVVAVRDSKHQDGPVHVFPPREWDAFVGGLLNGEFGQP